MAKRSIYFLCTGNSCRSQMAEGWATLFLGDKWDVKSAGIEAHGLNEKAVRVMAEAGVDISQQESSMIDHDFLKKATIVVTLCGDARDHCPTLPPRVQHVHWGFQDPAKAVGTEAEVWEVFRQVRDEIKERIELFKKSDKAH